ncbi:hypothetical protein [Streptomyces sp. NPDC047976]|uniref:hypothetical protein n=1 Tax=unclassified Streptomyces TaxID=2593676 RepID=UPI00341D60A6
MIRQPRLALLVPAITSAAVLCPLFAAPGHAAAPGAAPSARPAPSCQLVPDQSTAGGKARFALRLSGFEPNQSVRIEGGKTSFRTTVDGQGAFVRAGVPFGSYRVGFSAQGTHARQSVPCTTAPGTTPDGGGNQPVRVTAVEIIPFTAQNTVIDCKKTNRVEVDGKITATGKGDVIYGWEWTNQPDGSQTRSPSATVTFTRGTTQSHSLFKVIEVPPANFGDVAFRKLHIELHVPVHVMHAQLDLTLKCS